MDGAAALSSATGFFFQRGELLFLVTSRHVMHEESTGHRPDRLVVELHLDAQNLATATGFSIPLYRAGRSAWRQGSDGAGAGAIDVAAIEINRAALPENGLLQAFTPGNLPDLAFPVEIGSPLLVVGFPLGFHDTLHHLPVVRQATLASSFGLRFKGQAYFLTDARTHRGTSGAPVVMRRAAEPNSVDPMPWTLLGVHSARLDVGRDRQLDEALGLNCVWYSDILLTLTSP